MRAKKLPARLAAMAGFVDAGESIADIGADHGYLPLHLVMEGISPFAILTDARLGPLEKTRISVAKAGSQRIGQKIELRLGDGLAALHESEVDVVVIAGMGGDTIMAILGSDTQKTGSFRKYILQPRTKTKELKTWLTNSGWTITAEASAEERGRICDIITGMPPGGKHDQEV